MFIVHRIYKAITKFKILKKFYFMEPKFFASKSDFRKWLENNYNKEQVLWVGYYKKATSKPSITWPESVDEALCFGWIDGLRKSIDEISYKIRFTPRKPTSNWSKVNINRVKELIALDLMKPPGIEAFEKRIEKNAHNYSYEQNTVQLKKEYLEKIKTNKKAWDFFELLPPSAKRLSVLWVMSAKKEEIQQRRLDILIESSEQGQKVSPLIIDKRKK